jgi:hypothetical protein
MACVVHLLSSATHGVTAIADVQSASIDEGGSAQEYITADDPDVQLVAVDRIAATVTVTKLGYSATPAIGDVAASPGLTLVLKPRAEGKGVTASPVNIVFAKAVCTGKGSGPTIEGSPSYTITFRCYPAPA